MDVLESYLHISIFYTNNTNILIIISYTLVNIFGSDRTLKVFKSRVKQFVLIHFFIVFLCPIWISVTSWDWEYYWLIAHLLDAPVLLWGLQGPHWGCLGVILGCRLPRVLMTPFEVYSKKMLIDVDNILLTN